MMENSTANNRVDEDILQCKADILRLRNLTPPSEPKKEKLPDKNTTRSEKKPAAAATTTAKPLPPAPKIVNQTSHPAEKPANINDESDLAEVPFSESMGEDTIMTSDDSKFVRIPPFEEIMTRQSPFSENSGKKFEPPIPPVISENTEKQQEPSTIDDDDDEDDDVVKDFFENFVSDADQPQKTPAKPVIAPAEKPAEKPVETLIIKSAQPSPQKSSVEMVVNSLIDLPEKTTLDKPTGNGEEKENIIPEFNLAEQILSEQRKLSGAKRVAPAGKKPEPAAPLPDVIGQPVVQKEENLPAYADQKVIFAEEYKLPDEILLAGLVTRDIEKFYSLSGY